MEELVVVDHVNKHFGELHVLKDITTTVHRGEVVVVIGPSGTSLEWSDSGLPIGDSSLSSPGAAGGGAPLPSPYPSVGGSGVDVFAPSS